MGKPVKVRAVAVGHYGALRKVGEVFTIMDERHLGSWMEPVDPAEIERLRPRILAIREKLGARGVKSIPDGVPATTAQLKEPIVPTAEQDAPSKPDDSEQL